MYKPIDIITEENKSAILRYRKRWSNKLDSDLLEVIIEKLKTPQPDFERYDSETDPLILDNPDFRQVEIDILSAESLDLKGIPIRDEKFIFEDRSCLRNIDLSYSVIENCEFENCLINANFNLAILRNCLFRNCEYDNTKFYAAEIEACSFISCIFDESTFFDNCLINNISTEPDSFEDRFFRDCKIQ